MRESRLENTTKNAFTGFFNQLLNLVMSFISRTVFIHYLGVEFLGISGLFSNILQILSMADLGFNTAMVYSMYRPIANNDTQKLAALIAFYKKIYNIIAFAILLIGLCLVPLLPYIVNTATEIENLTIYYILYLLNTVMSYLFVYKTALMEAHQKSYILNNYDSVFIILQNIFQIAVLVFTSNFILYLLVQIIVSFLKNFYKARKTEKMYPYIRSNAVLDKPERISIFQNVKSMFIYKIGGVLLNNTSNILISIIVNTITVGYYSNYLIIITAANTFMNILFNSVTASLGNLNVSSDNEKQYMYFKRINFFAVCIFSFVGICFYLLLDDFITIWLGPTFTLDKLSVLAISLNFVIPGTIRTVSLYRDTMGMFKDTKYVFFVTAVINIIFSLLLGNVLGLAGVLFSTVIARILTNAWFEPVVLFKNYLHRPVKEYFKRQLYYWVVFFIILVLTSFICSLITLQNLYVYFVVKTMVCVIISVGLLCIFYFKLSEFKYLLELFKTVLLKVIKKA